MAPEQSSERDESHLQMTCDKSTVGPVYLPPGNKATILTTGDSESWELVQYLEYQCDVRRLPAFSYSKSFIKAIEARCMKGLSDIGLSGHDSSILFANEAYVFIPKRQSVSQIVDTIAFEQCKICTIDILKKCFSPVKPCVWIVDYEQTNEVCKFFYKYNITNEIICLLILGGDAASQKLHTHHNVIIAHTSDDNIIDALDDLLERFAFWTVRALTHKIKEKYGAQETLSDNAYEALHDVYDYIRSAYENSAVPNDEWPEIPASNPNLPENVDDAVESVIKIPGVLCCIKKMQRLEIYIDTAFVGEEEFSEQSVLHVLDRYNINNVLFTYGNLNRLFAAGSPISDGLGTLGGFAEKFSRNNDANNSKQVDCQVIYSRTQNPNLVALISKHVAMVSLQNKSKGCLKVSKKVIGYIKSENLETYAWLDIVPVDVLEDVQKDCVKQFRTKDGLLKFATLTNMKLCKGLPVHIWGAVSSPGLGYVSEIKDSDFKIDKNRYIILTSYNDGTKFCKPGDSGSIVCTSGRKGVTLHAIAMLIGEYIPMPTHKHITIKGDISNTAETTQEGKERHNTPCREKEKIKNNTEQTPNKHSGVKSDDTQTAQNIEEHILIQSFKEESKNETDTEEHINMGIKNPQGRNINQSFITDKDANSHEVKTEVIDQQRQG